MAAAPSSVLALDVGNKRVGLAITSMAARLPSPLTTLERDDGFWDHLDALVTQHAVDAFVVGLPRNLNSEATAQTTATQEFASELRRRYPQIVLHFQDEALTSVAAEEELKSRSKNYRRSDIDALAANYILSDWLSDQPESLS